MKNRKMEEKLNQSKEILKIRKVYNNIEVLFNEKPINIFPIRVFVLRVGKMKTFMGIWGSHIFKDGKEVDEVEIIVDFSRRNKLKFIYLNVNNSSYFIEDDGDEDIEFTIYFRNEDMINFIDVGYNVIKNQNNITFVTKGHDKLCEKFITNKIRYMFPETFLKMEEMNNEA